MAGDGRPVGAEVEAWLLPALILGAAVAALGVWLPAWLAHVTAHTAAPGNPLTYGLRLARHRGTWPHQAMPWAAAEIGTVLVAGAAVAAVVWRLLPRHPVDSKARHLRLGGLHRRYTHPNAAPPLTAAAGPGPLIGPVVGSGREIRATWEDVAVMIAGARMGKTTSQVVPTILDAPGPVYATSNKPDLVALTSAVRDGQGSRVWVFDPQRIAAGEATWWWNPLDVACDVAGARRLAGIFASATRPIGARQDAFFDPEGEELLAILLLAGACGGRSLCDVYRWVNSQASEPVGLLRGSGFGLAADGLDGVLNDPDRQRAGVFGTAKKMVRWIADPGLAAWVTDDGSDRPRFDAEAFATTNDTLYSLSREGVDGAGPLTAALTAAVVAGAERAASRLPGGRLATPMVCTLDEVANVCRWRELPDLYSHYGSRGIVFLSYLQSWSQGVECWGREGMEKLWSSANVRIYGGGATEEQFLEKLSRVTGEFDEPTGSSTSYASQPRSVTRSTRRRRILQPSELAALPPGRAVVLLSGAPPVLVAPRSCFEGPHSDAIQASLAAYDRQLAS